MAQQQAVFLDRDGTIVRDAGFVHRVEDLELLDGAAQGLRRIAACGYRLIIVTNQSGIARGYFDEASMHAFHEALVARLAAERVRIEAIYFCPFHPTEGQGPYRRESTLRKPSPGMIQRAAAEHGLDLAQSLAIGDKASDILAGQAAGCRTVLIRSRALAPLEVRADFVAADLVEAAALVEQIASGRAALRCSA